MARYTIKKGDNLTAIAKAHGTTVEALVSSNGIKNKNKIGAGQEITIPDAPRAPRARPDPKDPSLSGNRQSGRGPDDRGPPRKPVTGRGPDERGTQRAAPKSGRGPDVRGTQPTGPRPDAATSRKLVSDLDWHKKNPSPYQHKAGAENNDPWTGSPYPKPTPQVAKKAAPPPPPEPSLFQQLLKSAQGAVGSVFDPKQENLLTDVGVLPKPAPQAPKPHFSNATPEPAGLTNKLEQALARKRQMAAR